MSLIESKGGIGELKPVTIKIKRQNGPSQTATQWGIVSQGKSASGESTEPESGCLFFSCFRPTISPAVLHRSIGLAADALL